LVAAGACLIGEASHSRPGRTAASGASTWSWVAETDRRGFMRELPDRSCVTGVAVEAGAYGYARLHVEHFAGHNDVRAVEGHALQRLGLREVGATNIEDR
jgi:hypothetical protein